jgi:predicted nucleotidyltransferase
MNAADIEKAAGLLHRAAPDATIILFGSQARGDAASVMDPD